MKSAAASSAMDPQDAAQKSRRWKGPTAGGGEAYQDRSRTGDLQADEFRTCAGRQGIAQRRGIREIGISDRNIGPSSQIRRGLHHEVGPIGAGVAGTLRPGYRAAD